MTDKSKPINTPRPDSFTKRGGKVPTGQPASGLRPPPGGGSQTPTQNPQTKGKKSA